MAIKEGITSGEYITSAARMRSSGVWFGPAADVELEDEDFEDKNSENVSNSPDGST